MYLDPNQIIKTFDLCDFKLIFDWHTKEKEWKNMLAKEKKQLKEEKLVGEDIYIYMWALVDGVKEKVGNFKVELPRLFWRQEYHPKMEKLKTKILPHNIVINVGKDAYVLKCMIHGHRWKDIRHGNQDDNLMTCLAYWKDPILFGSQQQPQETK